MTTPDRRYSGTPLQRLAPSGSFLQQLLEEISGASPSNAHREQLTPQNNPTTHPAQAQSRRLSSVWVGGTSIAQDAREKLRAADEARLYKPSISGHDGAPDTPRPRLQLRIPRYNAPAHSLDTHSTASTPGNLSSSPKVRLEPTTHGTGSTTSHDVQVPRPRPRHRPSAGILRPPVSATNNTQPSMGYSEATGLASPLIICDADSDTSKTPSPLEEPLSATSDTLTDATTMSHERRASHSPAKRTLSMSSSPEMLSKKIRTMTLPEIQDGILYQSNTGRRPWRNSVGGDNRYIVHDSTFTERGHPAQEPLDSSLASLMPELSSFRPQVVDPQGVPRRASVARPSTRRVSMVERQETPEPTETPSYARSFHLVDTDVSVYRQTHGDAWRNSPLCLYCFRQNGSFRKIEQHGYETCGREEALESHYWE